MVSTAALIAALQGQFAAARQGQGQGATSALPGLLASGQNGEGASGVNALSGGISPGGIPGTSTSGPALAAGGATPSALASSDPLVQQALFGLRDGPSDTGDLGAGVTGGDVNTLLSVLGGPLSALNILGSLVASTELGLPPATSPNALLSSGGNEIGSRGIGFGNRESGNVPFSSNTGLSPPSSQNIGSLGIRREDRDTFGPGGSGSSPNRGTVSNAGR